MISRLIALLFPAKCVLCKRLLSKDETHFCRQCRTECDEFTKSKRKFPFVAQWTGIWYYSGNVKNSICRFKFSNARSYATAYAQRLALRLQQEDMPAFDLLSWVPVSPQRKRARGYDQGELLAQALARELGCCCEQTLCKIRNTPPQSGITVAAKRRANVQGAYRVMDPALIRGKRILLLDDVLTTGSTLSECAKTLMIGGAKEVTFATVAVAEKTSR